MKIIACLGNPGKKYHYNRHNIGFLIGEFLSEKYNISISQKKFNAEYGAGSINNNDVLLLFPHTYMNNSGQAVQAALQFYKSTLSDVIVIHDEIELPFGDIRDKKDGGHKGHNGLRSIIQQLGSADFYRLRFGVGRPENPNIPVADYVLSNFTRQELDHIEELMENAEQKIYSMINC